MINTRAASIIIRSNFDLVSSISFNQIDVIILIDGIMQRS